MGWTDPVGRPMMTKAVPVDSAFNPDHAGSVLAVTLVDTQGAPVTSFGGSGSGGGSNYEVLTYQSNIVGGQCVKIDSGKAYLVTSLDAQAPWVDGIAIQSAAKDAMGVVATSEQVNYQLPSNLSGARMLFLGQDGALTAVAPSRAAGDLWSVTVARKTGTNQFIFDPQIPIALI